MLFLSSPLADRLLRGVPCALPTSTSRPCSDRHSIWSMPLPIMPVKGRGMALGKYEDNLQHTQ
jgi:hypothetical protein